MLLRTRCSVVGPVSSTSSPTMRSSSDVVTEVLRSFGEMRALGMSTSPVTT